MTEETQNTETEEVAQDTEEATPEAEREESYFEHEEAVYRQAMAEDMKQTLKQRGFAFFHSLPPKERALYRERLGIQSNDPADIYNLGVACQMEGDMKKAVKCWERAIEMAPDFEEAEFNLALAYDEMGKIDDALPHYQRVIEIAQDPADIARVEERLSQMV